MGMLEPRRANLRHVLSRFHMRVAIAALLLAALAVLISGIAVLRGYAQHNLQLVGRYASYAVEPALAFDDAVAGQASIAPIASADDVQSLIVRDIDGRLFARWDSGRRPLVPALASLAYGAPARIPVVSRGRRIGTVEVAGKGDGLVWFLIYGLAGTVVCLVVGGGLTWRYAARLQRGIVGPLTAVSDVAHDVRKRRDFTRRAPRSTITEIDSLGQDFNALLDELQDWQEKQQQVYAALEHQASHDPLTRLANRARFEAVTQQAIRTAARYDDQVALLFLDANGFKQINDMHGHGAGDQVLIEIAERMRGLLRAGDVAARVGGDEFAVLVNYVESRETAQAVARRIAAAMHAPVVMTDGRSVYFSLSIGIAMFPDDGGDFAALHRAADADMYALKRAHINRVN